MRHEQPRTHIFRTWSNAAALYAVQRWVVCATRVAACRTVQVQGAGSCRTIKVHWLVSTQHKCKSEMNKWLLPRQLVLPCTMLLLRQREAQACSTCRQHAGRLPAVPGCDCSLMLSSARLCLQLTALQLLRSCVHMCLHCCLYTLCFGCEWPCVGVHVC
jgi:hypothetical protein